MNRFILDASVAASWAFPDEQAILSTRMLEAVKRGDTALVPVIWWFELRNAMIVGERRLRMSVPDTEVFLAALAKFDIRVMAPPVDDALLFTLARRHGLTFYDSAYLALAIDEGAPLATLDMKLATAAKREGVEVLG